LTKALGLSQERGLVKAVRPLFEKATKRFAKLGVGLDRVVGEHGVAAGARWVLPHFVKDFAACGVENIPAEGPLVIASNHPAACDSLVISAHVERPDYKIIIGDIPFFEHLPHVSQHAIYAPDPGNLHGRMEVMRKSIRYLEDGGALLLFARGSIEADPAFMPDADAEFGLWSRSLEIFLRRVPCTRVLVTIVSGVIARAAYRHPFTWFRRQRPDRQRLAFMYQMMRQILAGRETFGLTPRVSFGDLIGLSESCTPECALNEITASAQRLLQSHLAWQV
jgi:Acyltransferase